LATLSEIKNGLGVTGTDFDTQIATLINPVSALIEREAGRKFECATFTERHLGGEPTIALLEYPVQSITSVTDKATGEVLAATEYELEANTGLLRKLIIGSSWAASRATDVFYVKKNMPVGRWEIIYEAGTVPEDVKLALYYSVASMVNINGGTGGMAGMISESDGDYSYTRAAPASTAAVSGLPANAMAILSSYKAGVFI
jgi:non-ribosomal peptide synthetase component E (peptide arylation enzyme)